MRLIPSIVARFLLPCALLITSGCQKQEPAADAPVPIAATLRVLAGSELKDMEPLVREFESKNNVKVHMTYTGTLDAVDSLLSSKSYDAIWLADDRYLRLQPPVAAQLVQSHKIMYSTITLGVQKSLLTDLGWSEKVSWKQISSATQQGKLRLAMTSPVSSNTGFSALIGMTASLSGKADAFTAEEVPVEKLRELYRNVSVTASSSGTLVEKLIKNPTAANAMINYDVLISKVPGMVPVVITDGVLTANYPLSLLAHSKNKQTYEKLVEFLTSTEGKQKITATTERRTQGPGSGPLSEAIELPFPSSVATVNALLQAFLESVKQPTATIFVLDVSGSMKGERLDNLQAALQALIRADEGVASRFAAFHANETIVVLPFSDVPQSETTFAIPEKPALKDQVLRQLEQTVVHLQANGNTAIYGSVLKAQEIARSFVSKGVPASIVLMTDGLNNRMESLEQALDILKTNSTHNAPVYAIAYGEANIQHLQAIALATNGAVYNAKNTSLRKVFTAIRTGQ